MHQNQILTQKVEDTIFTVVDVETTGLNPSYNNIIEIALVKVLNNEIIDVYSTLVNPARDIPYFITQFTGISNDDVYNAPFFEDIVDEITSFVEGTVFTAHNLSFDLSFVRKEFRLCGIDNFKPYQLCTLKMARRLYPELKSKALGKVANHLRIINPEAHRAESDAKVTARILIRMINELKSNNGIKTLEELINFQFNPQSSLRKKVLNEKLDNDLQFLPDAPGVYYFLNSKEQIIYIGKAKSLRERIKSYFSSTAPSKSKKIVKQASKLKTEITNTELTALLLEAELIKIVDPKHNVQLKKYHNKYFLRINKTHPFPNAEITNHFDFDGNDYFGLFINRVKAAQIKEIIDKAFMLRECKDKEFNKGRECFLSEIERCTAPCVNSNSTLYEDELNKVYDFMCGKDKFLLERLLQKMKSYSETQKYEKAAEMRELINLVLSQIQKSSLLSEPINSANALIEISGAFNSKDFCLLLKGKAFIKINPISTTGGFENALDDYFNETRQLDFMPTEEDLEKIKIILNWIIKNRHQVRVFYLKNYTNREDLYLAMNSTVNNTPVEIQSTFNIKDLIK
ncbi:MAG TPA: exonuclease domain-containing protein [Ignavibacteriaceae bacterium]|nr:exonuclease domain-containing protein [Ignavibacteriaceae bacterium]